MLRVCVIKYEPSVWSVTIIIIKVDSPCNDYVPSKIIIYFTARATNICVCDACGLASAISGALFSLLEIHIHVKAISAHVLTNARGKKTRSTKITVRVSPAAVGSGHVSYNV